MPRKREIPQLAPVTRDGVRYARVDDQRARFGSAGSTVAAYDAASGAELWAVTVYQVVYDPTEEQDSQDVFITALSVGPDGKELLVENERKKRFAVRLSDRTVRAL